MAKTRAHLQAELDKVKWEQSLSDAELESTKMRLVAAETDLEKARLQQSEVQSDAQAALHNLRDDASVLAAEHEKEVLEKRAQLAETAKDKAKEASKQLKAVWQEHESVAAERLRAEAASEELRMRADAAADRAAAMDAAPRAAPVKGGEHAPAPGRPKSIMQSQQPQQQAWASVEDAAYAFLMWGLGAAVVKQATRALAMERLLVIKERALQAEIEQRSIAEQRLEEAQEEMRRELAAARAVTALQKEALSQAQALEQRAYQKDLQYAACLGRTSHTAHANTTLQRLQFPGCDMPVVQMLASAVFTSSNLQTVAVGGGVEIPVGALRDNSITELTLPPPTSGVERPATLKSEDLALLTVQRALRERDRGEVKLKARCAPQCELPGGGLAEGQLGDPGDTCEGGGAGGVIPMIVVADHLTAAKGRSPNQQHSGGAARSDIRTPHSGDGGRWLTRPWGWVRCARNGSAAEEGVHLPLPEVDYAEEDAEEVRVTEVLQEAWRRRVLFPPGRPEAAAEALHRLLGAPDWLIQLLPPEALRALQPRGRPSRAPPDSEVTTPDLVGLNVPGFVSWRMDAMAGDAAATAIDALLSGELRPPHYHALRAGQAAMDSRTRELEQAMSGAPPHLRAMSLAFRAFVCCAASNITLIRDTTNVVRDLLRGKSGEHMYGAAVGIAPLAHTFVLL
eukprot:gene20423-24461_t